MGKTLETITIAGLALLLFRALKIENLRQKKLNSSS